MRRTRRRNLHSLSTSCFCDGGLILIVLIINDKPTHCARWLGMGLLVGRGGRGARRGLRHGLRRRRRRLRRLGQHGWGTGVVGICVGHQGGRIIVLIIVLGRRGLLRILLVGSLVLRLLAAIAKGSRSVGLQRL